MITLYPPLTEASTFNRRPCLLENIKGIIKIDYELDLECVNGKYEDESIFGEYGLLTTGHGARLLWTQKKESKDMSVHIVLNVKKTVGQGFGSAKGQCLEVYIKYNPATLSGYGLRIERTTKYGFATDFK